MARLSKIERYTGGVYGMYKGHNVHLESTEIGWYIRVRHPNGCYVYDGYWRESMCKSEAEATQEALRGSELIAAPLGAEKG